MGTHNGGAEVTDAISKLDLDLTFRSALPRAPLAREIRAPLCGGGDDEPKGPTHEPSEGDDVELEDKPISATPRRYKVIFHNDDYTTMEFVVEVLKRFFHKTDTEAAHIMLTVHKSGAAVAGVYTRDVAETKKAEVMDCARENGMPLLLTTEPE
jgi:ATP-dependent Clp protease adaptor protein ClpS